MRICELQGCKDARILNVLQGVKLTLAGFWDSKLALSSALHLLRSGVVAAFILQHGRPAYV